MTYNVFEPRIGGTYTLNPNNVLRFSYGKYTQAPNTAYEQYNLLQQDLASYDATNFWKIGFTTTTHQIRPPTSNNYDFSWEHQSGDMSFKLTPFLRQTKDQIQNFFLDQKTDFVSGLNAGRQTSDGVEFELTKGDFNHNGLSGLLLADVHAQLDQVQPAAKRRQRAEHGEPRHPAVQLVHERVRERGAVEQPDCVVRNVRQCQRDRDRNERRRQPVLQRSGAVAVRI